VWAGAEFVSWDERFFDPIMLPGGRQVVMLRHAAQYITKLPKAEHDAEEWQAAMEISANRFFARFLRDTLIQIITNRVSPHTLFRREGRGEEGRGG
jgi:hypothetical protein